LQLLVLGIALGGIYALIALGYSMVYGVLRLINFAHGDLIMVGAFIGYFVAKSPMAEGLPLPVRFALVFVSAMLGCAMLGVLIERCAYRPIRHQPRLTALITAIGVSLFLEYGGQVVFGATPRQDLPLWLTEQNPLMQIFAVQITDKHLLVGRHFHFAGADALPRPEHPLRQSDAGDRPRYDRRLPRRHQCQPRHCLDFRPRLVLGGGIG